MQSLCRNGEIAWVVVPKWHDPWRSILEQFLYGGKTLHFRKNTSSNMSLAKGFRHVLRDGVRQQSPSTTFMRFSPKNSE